MDDLWSIQRFARWWFELPDGVEPSKSQLNAICKQCRDGNLPAVKICNSWRIDTSEILRRFKHGKKKSGAR